MTDGCGCSECGDLRKRVEELEESVKFLEAMIYDLEDVAFGDAGAASGQMMLGEHDSVLDAVLAIQQNANTDVRKVSLEARSHMLTAHRKWADIRDGEADSLGDSERRAAILFGAFIRRASGKTPTDDSVHGYNGVDASGQTYSMTSTEAARTLQETKYEDVEVKSMTVRRAFEKLQSYTQDEQCDCSTIDGCPHGLITFDSTTGTNRVKTNKARFNDAMAAVGDAVENTEAPGEASQEAGIATADDSISPEDGQDEAMADVDAELEEVLSGHPSNIVVRRGEREVLETDGGDASTTSSQ